MTKHAAPSASARRKDEEISDRPTFDAIIGDIGRELGMRRRCYPKWIKERRLSQSDADQRIACMDSLYAFLKAHRDELAMLYERTDADTLPPATAG